MASARKDETRASGDDLVLIGDGGGPFQAYGPLPGEPNPETLKERVRDDWGVQSPDKIERLKPAPRRQIVDDGGTA